MPTLRSEEMKDRYREYMKTHPSDGSCALCLKEPLKSFGRWKIINNEFPYDLVAASHHMVVPLRHVPEEGLNAEEVAELAVIKRDFIGPSYDYIIEATPKNKSIPGHFHLHLIVGKS